MRAGRSRISPELALEIAREGREGRRIGTLFTLGKADAVLAASRALILDPLAGHAPARTQITDPDLRGTMKELAQLDGAFVISEDGPSRRAVISMPSRADRLASWIRKPPPGCGVDFAAHWRGRHCCLGERRGACFMPGRSTLIPELWLDRHHTQLSVAAAGAVEAQRLGTATFSLSDVGEN